MYLLVIEPTKKVGQMTMQQPSSEWFRLLFLLSATQFALNATALSYSETDHQTLHLKHLLRVCFINNFVLTVEVRHC